MPYRDEIDALRERKSHLEAELARVHREASDLGAREVALASELSGVARTLQARSGPRRALPTLDELRVASPCKADWDEMLGDGRVRYCLGCGKNVYNLSALPREEAEAVLQERLGGALCVRFYKRSDGTILTQDCPVGVTKKRRRKLLALAFAGAGAMAAAAASALVRQGGVPEVAPVVMGQMELATPHRPAPGADSQLVEVKGEIAPVPAVGQREAPDRHPVLPNH